MDKRLLIALPICFLIVLLYPMLFGQKPVSPAVDGGSTSAPQPGQRTDSQPAVGAQEPVPNSTPGNSPSENSTAPSSTLPSSTLKPSADTSTAGGSGAGSQTSKETPALAPAALVVAEEARRDEVLLVGKPGDPGCFRAVFTNYGGALQELRTGNHVDQVRLTDAERADWNHWVVLAGSPSVHPRFARSFLLATGPSSASLARKPLDEEFWTMRRLQEVNGAAGVEFRLSPGTGVTFVKRFVLRSDSPDMTFELEIVNDSIEGAAVNKSFVLTPVAAVPADSGDSFYMEPSAVACRLIDGHLDPVIEYSTASPDVPNAALGDGGNLRYFGIYNKYFAVLARPMDDGSRAQISGVSWRHLRDEDFRAQHLDKAEQTWWRQLAADVQLTMALPKKGATSTLAFQVYAGSKHRGTIAASFADHKAILDDDMGFFATIGNVLVAVLNFFQRITNSWGFAIILLTFSVRLVLFPLTRRAQTAMSRYQTKMKRIQPKIDELKKRFEKDPSKLRQEQGILMQKEGAFPPLGGCLPPLLQIPVFFGLFKAVGVCFDLRQASFVGMIHDLSLPDQLIPFGVTLPLLGHVAAINLLPPIMVAMWIWQQRTAPMPTDPQQQTMYKMMMWMPVVMGVFLYNYAAGLSLYMITSSSLAIVEQKLIRKIWPIDETELPTKKGFLAKLAEAAEQQQKARAQTGSRPKARR